VQFAWRDDKLAVWCDCPHFVEQGVPCKHVWAAILAADQYQYLTAAASADKLILDLDALGVDGLAWIMHDFSGGKRKGALKD
jgi:uncharacterized Zn finger protein